jgi:hypothetical protein
MTKNEERGQEVPIGEIQPTSTPTSTITNSQFSLSQQSTSKTVSYETAASEMRGILEFIVARKYCCSKNDVKLTHRRKLNNSINK